MATRYVNTASTAGGDGTTNGTTGTTRAYASLNAWESARQTTLTEVEEVICEGTAADTSGVTIDGWTTTSSFYIDIKALPTAAAGRHEGVWSTSKYRLVGTAHVLLLREEFIKLTGIQISSTNDAGFPEAKLIDVGLGAVPATLEMSACILNGGGLGTNRGLILNTNSSNVQRIYNNIIYDCPGFGIDYAFLGGTAYVYNNTIQNCGTGFDGNSSWVVAKNNIVQDCTTCYTGTFNAASTNNCSDDGTQPGSNGRNGEVTFANEASDDFHLSVADTVARGFGANLSADANLAFSTDVNGLTRDATWDIGADAQVAAVYVNTAVASAGGSGRTNGTGSGYHRAFASLNAWEAARQHVLVETETVTCEGTAADTTAVTIDGWTTTSSFYITAQALLSAPAGRHRGFWSRSKYRLEVSASFVAALRVVEPYTRLIGLQIRNTAADAWYGHRHEPNVASANDASVVESCIIRCSATTHNGGSGSVAGGGAGCNIVFRNTITYDNFRDGFTASFPSTVEWLNCVSVNNGRQGTEGRGFNGESASNTVTARNCYSGGNPQEDYRSINTAMQTCASDDATGSSGLTGIAPASAGFTSLTSGSEDLHLTSGSVLRDAGTDLSGTFSADVDGQTRSGTWDIGADEYFAAAARTLFFTADGDPAAVAVSGATAGRLLVVTIMERSGGSATNHVLSNSGTAITFTRRVAVTVAPADTTYRRCASVWTGTVPAGSNVGTISADDGTANTKRVTVEEFSDVTESQFSTAVGADDGLTTNSTTMSTGNTPGSVSGDLFLWAGLFIKNWDLGRDAETATWTNGPDDAYANQVVAGIHGRSVRTTFGEVDAAAAGARATTITVHSWSGGTVNNRGLIGALLVFETGGGGGSSSGTGTAAGVATVSGVGKSSARATGSSAGAATVSGVGRALIASTGTSTSSSTVTGVGRAVTTAVGSAAGNSTATGVAASLARGVGSATGSSVVTGTASTVFSALGSSVGSAVVNGVGRATARATGSSVATSTAAAIGASIARSVGSSTGTSTVTGFSQATNIQSGVGSSAGSSTVSGIGRAVFTAQGSSSSVSTVTGVGRATARGLGSSAGVSLVTGTAAAIFQGVGSSLGSSLVTGLGVGIVTRSAIGSATGTSTVNGIGVGLGVNILPRVQSTDVLYTENKHVVGYTPDKRDVIRG